MRKRRKLTGNKEETIGLAAIELLKEISAETVRALETNSPVEEFPAGHIFFRTGEAGKGLYVVEVGRVQTYRDFEGKKLIIAELGPGTVFGEMGCVGQRVCHCVAQTTVRSRIRLLEWRQVEKLLGEYPIITRKLLDLVGERFVNTLLELETSSFRQLIPRLARLLLERAEGEWVREITHKELAERLRVYRETVTSVIGELRRAGIVAVERKRIRILERARLERAAREGT